MKKMKFSLFFVLLLAVSFILPASTGNAELIIKSQNPKNDIKTKESILLDQRDRCSIDPNMIIPRTITMDPKMIIPVNPTIDPKILIPCNPNENKEIPDIVNKNVVPSNQTKGAKP